MSLYGLSYKLYENLKLAVGGGGTNPNFPSVVPLPTTMFCLSIKYAYYTQVDVRPSLFFSLCAGDTYENTFPPYYSYVMSPVISIVNDLRNSFSLYCETYNICNIHVLMYICIRRDNNVLVHLAEQFSLSLITNEKNLLTSRTKSGKAKYCSRQ